MGLNLAIAATLTSVATVGANEDYGDRLGVRTGDHWTYRAAGTTVQMDALDPSIHRWYMPEELFQEYGRRQWTTTNYAKERYLRYLDRQQEGFYFYDDFGELTTRGWLIYDWRQTQPLAFESSRLTKTGRYGSFFQRMVISADEAGDYNYSIIIGDEINTTLTPMTFRKAGFNGVMTNVSGRNWRATGLFSRASLPGVTIDSEIPTASLENTTSFTGGRLEVNPHQKVTLGFTLANAHHSNGSRESFRHNPFQGQLTSGQLDRRLELLVVRLSDDSPEDGEGGAMLFSEDTEITLALMTDVQVGDSVQSVPRDTTIVGSSIGWRAERSGGKLRDGFLTADGADAIELAYPLAPLTDEESETGTLRLLLQQALNLSLSDAEDAITRIKNVRFRVVVANDYRIEVSSDRQTNPVGQPQFLVVERADGNIKSRLNQREVVFDYGIPTARHVYGITAEVRDFRGWDFYGEFNVANEYRKYPDTSRKKHRAITGIKGDEEGYGWMFNLSRRSGPWRFFLEGFGMEDEYDTRILLVDGRGIADYSPESTDQFYDFVDDNDDNDRHPDQKRLFQGSLIRIPGETFRIRPEGVADPAVFPGYDENRDFISDFNQNSTGERENLFPDYDEPFLRYNTDRPEFLFGIDLNNNGWAERFENDDRPDYPYRKDHWGYNAFASIVVRAEGKITIGRLQQDQRKTHRENKTTYALTSYDKNWARLGRLRIYDMLRRAEDDIPDDLSQWGIPRTAFGLPADTQGRNQRVPDPLAAEDTWINTFYADWSGHRGEMRHRHRLKWETWRQVDTDRDFLRNDEGEFVLDEQGERIVTFDPLGLEERNGREASGLFGFINKAEYLFDLGIVQLVPRVKSEYVRQTPFSRLLERRRSWDGLGILLLRLPVLRGTIIETGLEQRLFHELGVKEDQLDDGVLTGDFGGSVFAVQLTNRHAYLGYDLTTQMGIRYDRRRLERVERGAQKRTSGLVFLSVFAGL
ncbi:MAG: hypothetical protein VX733_14350 [Candidatus Latescibacterota bacterium]|nr:hypothetical protein [Candidatus Latescibacterota bacterium]